MHASIMQTPIFWSAIQNSISLLAIGFEIEKNS